MHVGGMPPPWEFHSSDSSSSGDECEVPSHGHEKSEGVAAGKSEGMGADGSEGAGAGTCEGDSDELWCTPAQLLSEIDKRLLQITQPPGQGPAAANKFAVRDSCVSQPAMLASQPGSLTGEALIQALQLLRGDVQGHLLESMRQKSEKGL